MAIIECVAGTLTIFGPPLVVFFFFVATEPLKVIVMTASAFFWLIALLFSSVLWFAVVPLRNQPAFALVFSVLIQEIMRLFLFYVVRRAELGLQKISFLENVDAIENQHNDSNETEVPVHCVVNNRLEEKEGVLNPRSLAYVSGLGFGLMYGVFASLNIIADMSGPGTVGLKGDPPQFFLISALIILAMIFLQTFWCIIAFQAIHTRSKLRYALIVIMHMTLSCLTLVNSQSVAGAIVVTCICYLCLIVCMMWSYAILGGVLPHRIFNIFLT